VARRTEETLILAAGLRCRRSWFRVVPALALLACLDVSPVHAYRILPANAVPGQLVSIDPPWVTIDKKVLRLAPGVRIRDRSNFISPAGTFPLRGPIVYTLDPMGYVLGIWVLTPEEHAALKARSEDR